MDVRLKFLEWLYTPQFLHQLYLKDELPGQGEIVYIHCDDAKGPIYWECTIFNYDEKYKFLLREKLCLNVPKYFCPIIRAWYDRGGVMRGTSIIWKKFGGICDEMRQLQERQAT